MMKLKILREALEYSPEKIDTFVTKATKDYEDGKRLFNTFKSKVEDLTISAISENPAEADTLFEKIEKTQEYIKNAHSKYFDVVNMYDYLDSPKNVKTLDRLVTEIDYLDMDLGYLKYALENLQDAAKQFSQFSKDRDS